MYMLPSCARNCTLNGPEMCRAFFISYYKYTIKML